MSAKSLDRRTFLALGAGTLGVLAAPSFLRPSERLVRYTFPVMGTIGEIAVPARNEAMARQAMTAAATELRRIEGLMTRFDPASEVGRFNAFTGEEWIPISRDTEAVVRESLLWAIRSHGAFNPALAPVTRVWDAGGAVNPMDRKTVFLRLHEVGDGWEHLRMGHGIGVVALYHHPSNPQIDLGGIAKGYGVDQAARVLREHGVFNGLINVGGDLMALGEAPGGRPWRVGVRHPQDPQRLLEELLVTDAAIATSGDYLRFFESQGRRHSHILDGRRARSADAGLRTVTVMAETAMTADAASTTVMVAGLDAERTVFPRMKNDPRIIHHG